MSCCDPKTSTPAQQARTTPQTTETPKGEAAGCCGDAKAKAKAPASTPHDTGAHTHAH